MATKKSQSPNVPGNTAGSGYAGYALLDVLRGGAAVACAKTAAAPLERVKLLKQTEEEIIKNRRLVQRYKGISDCLVRTYKTEGCLSLWRGNTINMIRCFPAQALNFKLNEYFRSVVPFSGSMSSSTKLAENIAYGAAAGGISLFLLYPFDYARTRLASDTRIVRRKSEREFSGTMSVFKATASSNGIAGVYFGFGPAVVGSALYRGLYFGLYDTLKPLVCVGKLEDNFCASVSLGWAVSAFAGLASYPFDTVSRRMMMSSGEPFKYTNSIDAWCRLRKEGSKTFFKGAGANVLRAFAAGVVLAASEKLHLRDPSGSGNVLEESMIAMPSTW